MFGTTRSTPWQRRSRRAHSRQTPEKTAACVAGTVSTALDSHSKVRSRDMLSLHSILDDDDMGLPPNKIINPNGPVKLPKHKPVPPPLVVPFLPLGGDYADILAYFVERGRPTYQFTGMPVTMALAAIELWAPVAIAPVPFVYLFLDNSIASQSWYYISAYLWNGG